MSTIRDFIVQRKLGEGSFSEVFQVVRKSDAAVYAMKKVKMQKLSAKEKENALNEVRILASINHPNVIGYKEAFFEDATNSLCIVMENADSGDLLQLINKRKKNKEHFTEKQIWHYLIQIVRGLQALHQLKICHRDIKCANLFLTKEGVIKLGDLNVSKVAKRGMLRTQTGTPYYACPEVWKDEPYDHRSDIWSLGCVLYEMITFQPPFRAQTMKGLYDCVCKGKYEAIPGQYSSDLKEMLNQCLQVKSANRADCEKILSSPGLVNQITNTLNDIQSRKGDESESLLSTIRCPRNLGLISGVMPAAQYKQSAQLRQVTTEKSERKPTESILDNIKENMRVSSAGNENRQEPVQKQQIKRSQSSSSNPPLKPHLSSRAQSPKSETNSAVDVQEILKNNQRLIQQLTNKRAQAKLVSPDLPTIEEHDNDMGTGMDQAKVITKMNNNILKIDPRNIQRPPPQGKQEFVPHLIKRIEPQSSSVLPATIQRPDVQVVERRPLYRPSKDPKYVGAPYSVDTVKRKASLYKDLCPPESQPQQSDSNVDELIADKVRLLKDIRGQERFLLPIIKQRHMVHQSVDSISLPSLPKVSDLYKAAEVLNQRPDLVNLRHKHRISDEQNQVADLYIQKLSVLKPIKHSLLQRPQSRAVNTESDENQPPVGFRAMLKRHQESQNSHIDRIRKNLPSAVQSRQGPREVQIINDNGDEVMRLKQQMAINRAKRLHEQLRAYKPSDGALNQYSPYILPLGASNVLPSTSDRVKCLREPRSAREGQVVNQNELRDLRRLL